MLGNVSQRLPLWLVLLLLMVALVLGTGLGYAQGAGLIKTPGLAMAGASSQGACTESAEVCAEFNNFWDVWNLAESRFLDANAIKPDEMITGAINGMLDALNDRGHTRYQTAEEYQRQRESLDGEFEGIGAYLNGQGEVPEIVAPIEGSPAEAAGILAGDLILQIDGVSTRGMPIEEVVRRVRGQPGTSVELQIQHLDQEAPVLITVTRAAIKVPAVTWRMLPDNIAMIRLSQFQQNAADEVQAALEAARAQGAKGIILDLRNNPGGLLDQAIAVTSQFLPQGDVVLQIRDRNGKNDERKTNAANPETELPMVVLINQGTASSAEILSGALQDYDRATLIGVRTPGAGSVLTPIELDDGSALYLGTAEWLTPKGRHIRNQGIAPDLTLGLTAGVNQLTPTTAKELTDAQIRGTEDVQVKQALIELGVQTTGPAPEAVVTPPDPTPTPDASPSSAP